MSRTLPATVVVLAAWIASPGGGSARADCALLDPGLDRGATPSAACLACHDGSAAPAVLARDSHPVDVSYAAAWLGGAAPFHGIVPRELALPDGRVACVSCHDGASPYPHRIAVEPARLCTACHAR